MQTGTGTKPGAAAGQKITTYAVTRGTTKGRNKPKDKTTDKDRDDYEDTRKATASEEVKGTMTTAEADVRTHEALGLMSAHQEAQPPPDELTRQTDPITTQLTSRTTTTDTGRTKNHDRGLHRPQPKQRRYSAS